jgi:hypothetical protein
MTKQSKKIRMDCFGKVLVLATADKFMYLIELRGTFP